MRIGILGAARIAPHVVIGPATRSGFAEVVAVAARDRDRASAFAAEHGVTEVEPDYDALIARDDLDLIYVALPNAAHAEWTIKAAGRGHAVLCEKPFATTPADVRAMVAAGETAGRPVLEAFHYRHHPLMHALVDLVRDGAIGPIVHAEASFVAELPRSDAVRWDAALGGGATLDLGCYAIHALRTLVGTEPEIVGAAASFANGVDASLEGDLVFPGGATGRVESSMVAGRRAATLRIRGERGSIEVDNFVAPQLPHRVAVRDGSGERELHFDGPGTFDHQLAHIRAVLAGDCAPLTGGADAIANMAVIDALYAQAARSAAAGYDACIG